jgi:hypothetical protein
MSGWLTGHYSLRCQPVDYSSDDFTVRVSQFKKRNEKKKLLTNYEEYEVRQNV